MALQELKRFSDLSACIDELIALEPESTKSYLVKGFHVQRNLNDSQAALKWFSKAVELDPSNLKNWKTKGDALMNLRHYSKALACFNAILSMNPQNECALRSKAICCLQNGALGKALESILIAYEINPENVDTLIGRGKMSTHRSLNQNSNFTRLLRSTRNFTSSLGRRPRFVNRARNKLLL
mmetsp:Transcript_2726/g.2880  ORF Transcript_2726/g.2880 Transcript_2726/m.2880 type:complete len:182 (+) Transcript_2726:1340-1885(+)